MGIWGALFKTAKRVVQNQQQPTKRRKKKKSKKTKSRKMGKAKLTPEERAARRAGALQIISTVTQEGVKVYKAIKQPKKTYSRPAPPPPPLKWYEKTYKVGPIETSGKNWAIGTGAAVVTGLLIRRAMK